MDENGGGDGEEASKNVVANSHFFATLLSAENAGLIISDVRPKLPAALGRFLDRDGRITPWPAKWKSQQVVRDYIIEKFAIDQDYREAEVNHLLNQWQTGSDAVTLRRA